MRMQHIINSNKFEHLDSMQKLLPNAVVLNTHNSLEHELKKCEIAYKLKKAGHTFVTESKLKNGKRPDILVLDLMQPIAYEIIHSETADSISKKIKTYNGIKIIQVDAKQADE